MPDLGPSLDILRKLGLSVPPTGMGQPLDDQSDIIARAIQENDPTWKKIARGGISLGVGAVKGAIGVDPKESDRINDPLSYWGNASSQITQAGLPLLSLTKGQPIFHGTQKVFEKFNPQLNDTHDVLGWMTHGTPDFNYADEYANGGAKHGSDWYNRRETMIAMKPEAKNTLDLIEPNADDMSAALAGMDPGERRDAIRDFKYARQNPQEYRGYLKPSHYPNPEKIPDNEIPVRYLADTLKLRPHEFDKTPFDAIRYRDVGNESYAIKPGTPIRSAFGAPMTDDAKELTVTKLPDTHTNLRSVSKINTKPTEPSFADLVENEIQKLKAKGMVNFNNPNTFANQHINKNITDIEQKPWEGTPAFKSKSPSEMNDAEFNNLLDKLLGTTSDITYPVEKTKNHPIFGNITKTDAGHLVNGGDISMDWYMNHFGDQ